MIEIKDLLAKWSGILVSEEVKKDYIVNTMFLVLGIRIEKEKIKIKNDTIYLDIKPIYKNEIFLKKEKIFSILGDYFGKKMPKAIR